MTLEERVAQLEALLAKFELRHAPDGTPYYYLNGAFFGGNTEFFERLPPGEKAGISFVGQRFAIYGEVDEITCTTNPTVGIYGAVTAKNPLNNIGVLGVANGGPVNYGLMSTSGDRTIGMRREGFELIGYQPGDRIFIGPAMGPYKQLWP